VKTFIDSTVALARERKLVETLRGRRRPMPDIDASDPNRRAFAERAAVNTVVQGSAADMMKLAMTAIHRRMEAAGLRARMLLQIHDELLFEAPPEEKAALEAMTIEEMSGAMALDVPVRVNVASGPNWAEAK